MHNSVALQLRISVSFYQIRLLICIILPLSSDAAVELGSGDIVTTLQLLQQTMEQRFNAIEQRFNAIEIGIFNQITTVNNQVIAVNNRLDQMELRHQYELENAKHRVMNFRREAADRVLDHKMKKTVCGLINFFLVSNKCF